jgi:hypothetical protein
MKYRGTASCQIVLQNSQPVNENIEFAYCEFTDDHDFAFFRYGKDLPRPGRPTQTHVP